MLELEINGKTLTFEHSLVALSEWEADHNRAFFPPKGSDEEPTDSEMLDYFKCMLISNRKNAHLLLLITKEQRLQLTQYMASPRSGTVIHQNKKSGDSENISSELIYYWMLSHKIDISCEKWHLNRLFKLIEICSIKNAPKDQKKQSPQQIAQYQRELNAARRAKANSKG